MIILAIAGALCSEGFYRCYESHSCPALIKKRFDPFVKNLESIPCIKIAQGLNEELHGLKEAIKVIAKKPPTEILQAIDKDCDRLASQHEEKLAQL